MEKVIKRMLAAMKTGTAWNASNNAANAQTAALEWISSNLASNHNSFSPFAQLSGIPNT
jgi:hypothetical protein